MSQRRRSQGTRSAASGGSGRTDGPPPTVFVVDDDAAFVRSLERMLRASGYVVSSFTSAADLLERRPAGAAGCLVADLKMPGMDGMSLQQALSRSDDPLPIVFLTGHGDIPTSVTAIRRGAEDFLTKTAPRGQLLGAIERALARDELERSMRTHRQELRARINALTPREREVLVHVLRGERNKQIAAGLGIDERSVKRHRTHLMAKLQVTSVTALTQLAVEARIASDGGPAETA